ncbi:helix-turn-helix transcriptional regulator [Streptomyces sp. NBC_01335]|uniref:helix-turn-helix domain-containing protein n=1 Tax=Streptomyces sp. NBC_01335 TaxID=2903828 RepID=UPI002E0D4523|nr:helix-turn-helix transcriptional regulator [Streptomyces sp. NBC_01335]
MIRRLGYHWHLRRIMAAHNIWKTTELIPLLRERGVNLSTAQVYRLVTDRPERLSLPVLAALCDILDCSPADLIEPYVEADRRKRTAGEAAVIEINSDFRPERARIVED